MVLVRDARCLAALSATHSKTTFVFQATPGEPVEHARRARAQPCPLLGLVFNRHSASFRLGVRPSSARTRPTRGARRPEEGELQHKSPRRAAASAMSAPVDAAHVSTRLVPRPPSTSCLTCPTCCGGGGAFGDGAVDGRRPSGGASRRCGESARPPPERDDMKFKFDKLYDACKGSHETLCLAVEARFERIEGMECGRATTPSRGAACSGRPRRASGTRTRRRARTGSATSTPSPPWGPTGAGCSRTKSPRSFGTPR